jgi:hypothetical protein
MDMQERLRLMIEEPRAEDAIKLLKDFKPKGGIILW